MICISIRSSANNRRVPLKLEDSLTLIAAVSKDRSINALFEELSKLGIKIKSMRNESNRLEELFIEMVNSNEK